MSPGEKPHLRINFLMGKATWIKHTIRFLQLPAAPEETPFDFVVPVLSTASIPLLLVHHPGRTWARARGVRGRTEAGTRGRTRCDKHLLGARSGFRTEARFG